MNLYGSLFRCKENPIGTANSGIDKTVVALVLLGKIYESQRIHHRVDEPCAVTGRLHLIGLASVFSFGKLK